MMSIDMTELQAGTSVPAVKQSKVARLTILVPSLNEQNHIVAYLNDLQTKIEALKSLQEQTTVELDALLPSMLDKAFKGDPSHA